MYGHLLHSHLLQSLGNAIIHSLWQALVLLLAYKAITALKKDLQPAVKHNLSAIFVMLTFGWFVYTFQSKYFLTPVLSTGHDAHAFDNAAPGAFSLINVPTEISAALSIAYLVLLSFLLTRLLFAIAKTLRIHTANLSPAGDTIKIFTRHAAGLLKIKRNVTVWIGKNVSVPATIGFFKPIILLPAVCVTHLTPQQVEAIILHELSHIRRNDFVLNLVLVAIETILFFNPAVFIFMRTIRAERENCCDDLVLKNNYEPLHYAKALLAFGREQLQHQKFAMNAVSRKHQLLYRIKRITGGDLEKPVYFSGRIALLAMMAFLFFSFAVFEKQKYKPAVVPATVASNTVTASQHNTLPPPVQDTLTAAAPVERKIKPRPEKTPLPARIDNIPQLTRKLSASIAAAIHERTADFENIPDKQALVAIGADLSEQINYAFSQLSDKKLQALVLQQKDMLNGQRLREALKDAETYKERAEQMYKFSVNGDSVYFHSGTKNVPRISVEGKNMIIVPQDRKKVTVTPQSRTFFNFRPVKRLKTADI